MIIAAKILFHPRGCRELAVANYAGRAKCTIVLGAGIRPWRASFNSALLLLPARADGGFLLARLIFEKLKLSD